MSIWQTRRWVVGRKFDKIQSVSELEKGRASSKITGRLAGVQAPPLQRPATISLDAQIEHDGPLGSLGAEGQLIGVLDVAGFDFSFPQLDREFNYGWKTRLLANLTKREYQLSSQAKLDDEEILNVNARLDDQQNQAEISADFVTDSRDPSSISKNLNWLSFQSWANWREIMN